MAKYACNMLNNSIELQVSEAYDRDVGRSIARMDYDSMNLLGVHIGDIIIIKGNRKTVARCLPLYPTDERRRMIRMDGLSRYNAQTEIGYFITIQKTTITRAEHVTIKPLASFPPVDGNYITKAMEQIPIVNGDDIFIPYFGGRLAAKIVDLTPNDITIVDPKTVFHILKDVS